MTGWRVAAVIVNWNGREDTLACLRALAASERPPEHTVVVDNGSADSSVEVVQAAFPAVEIVALPRNLHFAAGANAGMRRALAWGVDAVWLLNNDTIPAPDALGEMLRGFDASAQVGIAGARLVHPGSPPRVVVGAECDFRTGAIIEPTLPPNYQEDWLDVDYVWGCAMLIRAGVLREVGLFDESLVAYFEDTDLCLRARAAGWRTVTAVQAVVRHHGSKSADRAFLRQMVLRGRNWLRVYLRHAPPENRVRLAAWMLGWRLPHLAWSTLVTIAARTLRPRGRAFRLWSRR
jgi:GT2 family glycosyltransferase